MPRTALRCRLAYDASLVTAVAPIFQRAVSASIRRRAGMLSMGCMLALDGLYLESGNDPPVFRRVRRRVGKLPRDGGLDSEADAYGPAPGRAASAG